MEKIVNVDNNMKNLKMIEKMIVAKYDGHYERN
jgi:hypothetical protein